jgi:hypothetical protein
MGREYDDERGLTLVGCPTCGAPAEVVWTTVLASTDGLVEHVDVRCVRRHGYFGPAEALRDAA